MEGNQVKTPFSGKKYLSDARHFRAVGWTKCKPQHCQEQSRARVEKGPGPTSANQPQGVSDNYAQELVGNQASEAIERFETLAREVTNTTIGDIRTLGEDIRQLDDNTYRVHVAIEVKKKAMLRFLKNKARNDAKISELVRSQMVMLLDKEIERLDSEEK